jgi:hypothetical protein
MANVALIHGSHRLIRPQHRLRFAADFETLRVRKTAVPKAADYRAAEHE